MYHSTTPSAAYPCSARSKREQQKTYSPSPSETLREGGPDVSEGGPAVSEDALLLLDISERAIFEEILLLLLTREANTKKRDPGGCDLVFITCLDPKHLSIPLGDGAGTFDSRVPKHPLPQAATNLPRLCALLRRVGGEQTKNPQPLENAICCQSWMTTNLGIPLHTTHASAVRNLLT